jgi:hypothetical protein
MIPFSFTGNAGSTLSHVVIPAGGRDRIRLQYVSATSDKAASLLSLKSASKTTTVTAASAFNQTVINAPPYSGAAANDVVVLFSSVTGTGVRGVVASVDAVAGTITLNANLGLALAPGDTVHLMAAKGQIPVGAATKEANAPTVFAVAEGPALIELDGTSACRINLVAGEYS